MPKVKLENELLACREQLYSQLNLDHEVYDLLPFRDVNGELKVAFMNINGAVIVTNYCGEKLRKLMEDLNKEIPEFARRFPVRAKKREYITGMW